ncbi:DNA-binding transcription factor activity [Sparganum proliferum]
MPKEETLPCTDIQCLLAEPPGNVEKVHIVLAVYASGFVRIWQYMSKSGKKNLACEWRETKWRPDRCSGEISAEDGCEFNQILACSCSLDGQRFITAGTDTSIRVYEISSRKLIGNCQSSYIQERMDGHVRRITALKYHPRGVASQFYAHLFISGSWDDSIQIWDDRYEHSLWQYFGPHICGNDALDIEPEANHIITSSWRRDNSILQVWLFNEEALMNFFETGTKEPIRGSLSPAISRRNSDQHLTPLAEIAQNQLEPPTSGYVARWLGTKFMLYGGSDENILKIIDKSTLNTIASLSKFRRGVVSAAFTLPQATEAKQTIRLAVATGCKVYIAVLDCTFS